MSTLGVIVNAEFVRRVRSRAFMAGTLLGAIGILALVLLPTLIGGAFSSAGKRVILVGEPALTATAKTLLSRDFVVTETLTRLDQRPTVAFLDAHGKASAVAFLAREREGLRVTAYARDPSSFRSAFARDLAPIQIALATGAPVQRVAAHTKVPVTVRDVEGRFSTMNAADAAKGVAYLFVMLLYIAILLNAQQIMTSVAEEKTSRIAELLVSAVDPAQLLAAKLLAAAGTGFAQLAVWVATGIVAGRAAAALFATGDAAAAEAPLFGTLEVSSLEILAFIAFFVVGFAQYGVVYAAAASLINRTEDLGTVAGPLVVPVVLGVILAQFGLASPNSPNVVACSFVPLIAPFVMFTRVAVSNVPAWQLLLSLAINVAGAVLLAWAAGRVYRVGLLLYGRPPSLKQIVAAMRA